ncbi:hypothetical protein O3P69_000168 [Scylla paramamosain]|uniref:Uncharacterized protein n=1 Tax=Scylla paramamosain TaxID=85552 RepID=A0AAW0UUU2_SCYPA
MWWPSAPLAPPPGQAPPPRPLTPLPPLCSPSLLTPYPPPHQVEAFPVNTEDQKFKEPPPPVKPTHLEARGERGPGLEAPLTLLSPAPICPAPRTSPALRRPAPRSSSLICQSCHGALRSPSSLHVSEPPRLLAVRCGASDAHSAAHRCVPAWRLRPCATRRRALLVSPHTAPNTRDTRPPTGHVPHPPGILAATPCDSDEHHARRPRAHHVRHARHLTGHAHPLLRAQHVLLIHSPHPSVCLPRARLRGSSPVKPCHSSVAGRPGGPQAVSRAVAVTWSAPPHHAEQQAAEPGRQGV